MTVGRHCSRRARRDPRAGEPRTAPGRLSMTTTNDPHAAGEERSADDRALAEAARQAQAVKTASDAALIDILARKRDLRLAEAPELALEAELTRRGCHYDEEKGTWVK